MNEYVDNDYENDVEIDLVDLIFYLLKKWKILIIAVILGGLLGGGFCALRAMTRQNEVLPVEAKTEKDYHIDDKTLNNMATACQLRTEYLRQKEYNENSLFMKLDPNAFYRGTIKYYIPSGENTQEIWLLYQDIVDRYEFYEDLASAIEVEGAESSYLSEMVSVSADPEYLFPLNSEVDVSAVEEEAASEEEEESEPENGATGIIYGGCMVTYTVMAEDENSCRQMLEVIRKKVKALDKSCELQYSDYNVSEIGESVQLVSNGTYLTNQKTNVDQMNADLTNALKLEDAFSSEEKEYYNKFFLRDSETIEAETSITETSTASFKISNRSMMKWILLGIFAGIMVWGFCYLIAYLMDSSVKTVGELRDAYHLPLLGHVCDDETTKKNWVDRFYTKVKGDSDTIPYVISEIDTMEKGPIALCGDKEYNDVQTVMVELAENCSDVSANDFASKSTTALQKAKEAGSEIIIVRLGKTKRAEVRRELEVCRMQNIKVAGIIAVEDA